MLNPKVGLFFVSFLLQFVRPGETAQSAALAFFFLGLCFIVIGFAWMALVVWFADAMTARARQSSSASIWMQRGVGALFVGLAGKMGLSE
jgi:threonine/homoserine/homoserine lactone efflux protein